MSRLFRPVLGLIVLLALHRPAAADVISDWNEKVISFAIARGWGPAEIRFLAMTDLAMFDAVNAVERGYRPYLMNFVVTGPTSKEAAAASAAANVLAGVDPSSAKEAKAALAAYLADIPDGMPKQNGIELPRCLRCVPTTARRRRIPTVRARLPGSMWRRRQWWRRNGPA